MRRSDDHDFHNGPVYQRCRGDAADSLRTQRIVVGRRNLGGRQSSRRRRHVQVRHGHVVVYDRISEEAVRAVYIAGVLTFAPDKDTQLDVGLIRIQAGDDVSEEGFDCDAHLGEPTLPRPALEVGTQERPIDAKHTAKIRLVYFPGMDKQSLPAVVCCGGRMDLHGAAMNRTWIKLGATAKKGDTAVTGAETVEGWRPGDHILVTNAQPVEHVGSRRRGGSFTEERTLRSIDGATLTLDKPLEFEHLGTGDYRGEIANLSRNVIIESVDPAGVRGHTMYHRGSTGSISYAEFRHLGKEGMLGRYSLHYHLVRRHHARQFRRRGVDLGQRQSLADHSRHELFGRARLRGL